MRIAAVQHDIVWNDRQANFARLAPMIRGAVGAGADLVLLTVNGVAAGLQNTG